MINQNLPHRRLNPLTGEWILVSPHRSRRPWNGADEQIAKETVSDYDPSCYLCPGNERAGGQTNPDYTGPFAFTNDHPALLPDAGNGQDDDDSLLISHQESGTSRVICYSPSHAKTMAHLAVKEITGVVRIWKNEYETIGANPHISYVQIFQNKGILMGASSPHPHCQIWANEHIPTIPTREQQFQKTYFDKHSQQLLCEYLRKEQSLKNRIIGHTELFTALVPYWAVWPYETMILPNQHLTSLSHFTEKHLIDLARILSRLTRAYDRVFSISFPYSMGIHQAPTDSKKHDEWQFHMHFYPPLLRSASVKKYYVGYEMMAEAQRDITPEETAKTLASLI